jgi:DNA repair exonuclease SbcCD ATPase subunit
MLKRQQSMCKLNMLFLDEVDTALDSHLAAQITNSITNVLTKKLGYAQILMVSHKEEVKNAVPHILKVTRKKTRSVVEFV